VGGGNTHAVFAAVFPDDRKNDRLAAVVVVNLIARFILFGSIKRLESGLFGGSYGVGYRLTLRFCSI
jgi:hypothetical protein